MADSMVGDTGTPVSSSSDSNNLKPQFQKRGKKGKKDINPGRDAALMVIVNMKGHGSSHEQKGKRSMKNEKCEDCGKPEGECEC